MENKTLTTLRLHAAAVLILLGWGGCADELFGQEAVHLAEAFVGENDRILRFSLDEASPLLARASGRWFWGVGGSFDQLYENGATLSGSEYHGRFLLLERPSRVVRGEREFDPPAQNFTLSISGGRLTLRCGQETAEYERASPQELAEIREELRRDLIRLHALPPTSAPQYLFRAEGTDEYLYVDAPKFQFSFEAFRLFAGPAGQMREITLSRVGRMHDGGTTRIETMDGGVLYVPSPRRAGERASWRPSAGVPEATLESVPADFDLGRLGLDLEDLAVREWRTPCAQFDLWGR